VLRKPEFSSFHLSSSAECHGAPRTQSTANLPICIALIAAIATEAAEHRRMAEIARAEASLKLTQ
jgi:hypothetical protein